MKIYANNSNLCATDHLGRKLPSVAEAGAVKEEKVVGLFYYLWHGYHGTQGPYDITKILQADPDAMNNQDSPAWPPAEHTPMLHWGEPMFGYYISQDEWVLRRHVQMFIDAGVDVLFFDVTNGFTYRKAYLKLFAILSELRKKGFKAPQVAFYTAPAIRGCGTGNMMDLWEQLYEPRLYSDLYFHWKGKPLIICHDIRSLPDEIREFFTWRKPTWNEPKEPNTWAWEGNPQKVSVDENGNPEEVAVSVQRTAHDPVYDGIGYGLGVGDAAYGVPIFGRSWHNGAKDERKNASHYGFLFQEQIEFALQSDAKAAFICQWNEWLVPFLTKATNTLYSMNHPIRLQDEFSEEYSRDIEPMQGGYKDAYYLQMMSFIRHFKGMEQPAIADKHHTININDDFSQWDSVNPIYREYTGDTAIRYCRGYDNEGIYENHTGRNEFKLLQVASDAENIYFYAECVNDIKAFNEENGMLLFLKISDTTAWEGYNYVVNRKQQNDKIVLEGCTKNGVYEWQTICEVDYVCQKNKLHLCIPKAKLEIDKKTFSFEFKWSDNMQKADVMDFYVNGDCAPRGRLNYLYIFE